MCKRGRGWWEKESGEWGVTGLGIGEKKVNLGKKCMVKCGQKGVGQIHIGSSDAKTGLPVVGSSSLRQDFQHRETKKLPNLNLPSYVGQKYDGHKHLHM